MKNLDQELNKTRQKEDSNSGKQIEEALLFLNAPGENLEILQKINLDHQIHKNKNKVKVTEKLNAFEKLYNLKTFTGKDIKKLCIEYDLKCLEASNYKGKVDSELANKLLEFQTENKITLRARNCFILSTRESFKEENDNLNHNSLFLYCEREETGPAKENEIFSLIHTWGIPLSDNRKYRFLRNHGGTYIAFLILLLTIFIPSMWFTLCAVIISIISIKIVSSEENSYDLLWNKIAEEKSDY